MKWNRDNRIFIRIALVLDRIALLCKVTLQVQDAYEEVEEQRAVAAGWKRKLQKLTNDMADLRSLLDEQVYILKYF